MGGEICTDNRFEIIAAYKKKLIEGTNIQASPEEMAVIDNILFRFWQMRWLPPIPHGRLIDADALTETTDGIWDCNDLHFQPNDKICDPNDCKGCKWRETMDCFRRMVRHAPAIIPAEKGEA